jgi:catechol 2,3-dioxygenase-like lactoylglutathione lyase family enzyme
MGLSDSRVGAVVAVSDLGAARRFYEDTLGLKAEAPDDNGVRYPCADGTALFVYSSPENAGKSPATVAGWAVADFEATLAELEGRGARFEQYDQPGIKTDERGVFDTGSFRVVWVTDPDGNTLAINEDPEAR